MDRRVLVATAFLMPFVGVRRALTASAISLSFEGLGEVIKALEQFVVDLPAIVNCSIDVWRSQSGKTRLNNMKQALTNLSAELQGQVARQSTILIPRFQDYLDHPSKEAWGDATQAVPLLLDKVKDLLSTLEQDKNIFVTDPAYGQLAIALNARQVALERWISMQPPNTDAEIESVRRGVKQYKHLIDSLESAIAGLNAFIVKLDQSQPQFAPCNHPPSTREDHG